MDTPKKDPSTRQISEHVSHLLSAAVGAYTEGDFKTAIEIYLSIIKIKPNLPEVYLTLATIYEEVCFII